jgi:hypothetical protein
MIFYKGLREEYRCLLRKSFAGSVNYEINCAMPSYVLLTRVLVLRWTNRPSWTKDYRCILSIMFLELPGWGWRWEYKKKRKKHAKIHMWKWTRLISLKLKHSKTKKIKKIKNVWGKWAKRFKQIDCVFILRRAWEHLYGPRKSTKKYARTWNWLIAKASLDLVEEARHQTYRARDRKRSKLPQKMSRL